MKLLLDTHIWQQVTHLLQVGTGWKGGAIVVLVSVF